MNDIKQIFKPFKQKLLWDFRNITLRELTFPLCRGLCDYMGNFFIVERIKNFVKATDHIKVK